MALPTEKRYTYADLLNWDDDVRAELIEGEPVMLAAPDYDHQVILLELGVQFHAHLRGKRCNVVPAPFDVQIFSNVQDQPENIDTVVQPDLSLICDHSKIVKGVYRGAPPLIIEVLSPSNLRHDRIIKHSLYQRAGVQEYWIVDPIKQMVLVHTLNDGRYGSPVAYTREESVPVGVLEGCEIDLRSVFPE